MEKEPVAFQQTFFLQKIYSSNFPGDSNKKQNSIFNKLD